LRAAGLFLPDQMKVLSAMAVHAISVAYNAALRLNASFLPPPKFQFEIIRHRATRPSGDREKIAKSSFRQSC
jgi:hypothetical protein